MTFKIDSWKENQVSIDSPIYGKATLKGTAIERVMFHRQSTANAPKPVAPQGNPRTAVPEPPINDVEIEDGAIEEEE